MNEQELFFKDGKSSGIWFCEKCKRVANNQAQAAQCCKPNICHICQKAECENYYVTCKACRDKDLERMELATYNKAVKIEEKDYKGAMIYAEGYGDDYFSDVDELLEYCEADEIEPPKHVYGTEPVYPPEITIGYVADAVCDDCMEEFDFEASIKGVPELKAALEEFNKKNEKVVMHYVPDFEVAIIMPKDKEKPVETQPEAAADN